MFNNYKLIQRKMKTCLKCYTEIFKEYNRNIIVMMNKIIVESIIVLYSNV